MAINKKQANGTYAGIKAMLDGLGSVMPDTATMLIDGKSYTKQELIQQLEEEASIFEAVPAAEKALDAAREARAANLPACAKFLGQVKSLVNVSFGVTAAATCGVERPKARAALSSEANAIKTARARATREARGTMGKRQKAKIKGVVAAVPTPTGPTTPGTH